MNLKHRVEIQVEEQAGKIDNRALQISALATLSAHELANRCELVVVISDDPTLHDLNLRFRGEDHPTDVLSFANETRGPYSGGSLNFPHYLGDIVISIDRARAQAEAAPCSLVQELQLLTVHGVLHLLGYEHEEARDKERMWKVQASILQTLGADIPLPE